MPRRTKILATLGPDSSDTESIRRLIVAGVNVFRLNFSHGSAEEHSQRAHTIRNISKSLKTPVGILCDMQGPKIRIGSFSEDKKISLKEGDKFTLDSQCHPEQGDEKSVFIAAELLEDIEQDDILLLDDGRLTLQVSAKTDHAVDCVVTQGGILSSKKGVNKFGGGLSANALTDKDKADIKTAAALNTDYLAISFVRSINIPYVNGSGLTMVIFSPLLGCGAIPALKCPCKSCVVGIAEIVGKLNYRN